MLKLPNSATEVGELWYQSLCERKPIAFYQSLLAEGMDIHVPVPHVGSALIGAIYFDHKELVQLLLEQGADVTAIDPETGFAAYPYAVYRFATDISKQIAIRLQQLGLAVPGILPPPPEYVAIALQQERKDLIQLSLYGAHDEPPLERLQTIKQQLGYPAESLPFEIVINDDDDEEDDCDSYEDYVPGLSQYNVIFRPSDLGQFILWVEWYDDLTYTPIYHLHIRCKHSEATKVKRLLKLWDQEDNQYKSLVQRYSLGMYLEAQSAITEADQYYLAVTTAIAKRYEQT